MGGNDWQRLAENCESEKRQIPRRQGALRPGETTLANVLRKIEQSQLEECQNSEYLTLLSSFLDVKKSD
jgi:NADH dehydrogenase FAD-containing subunit